MKTPERSLVESTAHAAGRYGGFSFGGQAPEGVVVHRPLPRGSVFPNGARAAVLLTFDVEGNYGNGRGDVDREVADYRRICERLRDRGISATFNIVGQMAEDRGPQFVEWMLDAGCEVASHGYVHDLNKRHGGDRVYAGHYGLDENRRQVNDGIAALQRIRSGCVRGIRLPYGHFNEFSYQAIEEAGLAWASHVGAHTFGPMPFQMQLGERVYNVVEIPLDAETFDWAMWVADSQANPTFVRAVERYCASRGLALDRTPAGAAAVWRQRVLDAIERHEVYVPLCHPINLTLLDDRWGDAVDEFLLPSIDFIAEMHHAGRVWAATCGAMADFWTAAT